MIRMNQRKSRAHETKEEEEKVRRTDKRLIWHGISALTQSIVLFVDSIQLWFKRIRWPERVFALNEIELFSIESIMSHYKNRPNRRNYVRFNWYALDFVTRVTLINFHRNDRDSVYDTHVIRIECVKCVHLKRKNVHDHVKDHTEPSIKCFIFLLLFEFFLSWIFRWIMHNWRFYVLYCLYSFMRMWYLADSPSHFIGENVRGGQYFKIYIAKTETHKIYY